MAEASDTEYRAHLATYTSFNKLVLFMILWLILLLSCMALGLVAGVHLLATLGGIGGTYFTPIINAPEVAIMGVCKSSTEPVWDGKQFVPRLMLPLSLSYDHRVIDGAQGARFIAFLGSVLSDIRRLVL